MAEQALQTTITHPDLDGQPVDQSVGGEVRARPIPEPRPADRHGWWWGTGRRKTAVARCRLRPAMSPGQGTVQVQITRKKFKAIDEYFTELRDQRDAMSPLDLSGLAGEVDVFIRVAGGGYMGQAQAIRLGISRAIVGYEPRHEAALRDAGFMSRDARKVERKKYGQPGARRRFQFSKR